MNLVYAQKDNNIGAKWIEGHNVWHSIVEKNFECLKII